MTIAVANEKTSTCLSGRDLALKIHRSSPVLPVVYTSGYGRDATLPDFRETSTESHLPKPCRVGRLIEALGRVLAAQTRPATRKGECLRWVEVGPALRLNYDGEGRLILAQPPSPLDPNLPQEKSDP